MADQPERERELRSAPATAEPTTAPRARPRTEPRRAPEPAAVKSAPAPAIPVNIANFARAESDLYFSRSPLGRLEHYRAMAPIDQQIVVRMNRDTLYSSGVFDLDAGPVTITLPDPGTRFMSLMVLSQDHYVVAVEYPPGRFTCARDKVGTRYAAIVIRTLAKPLDPADMRAAHALQDAITVEQASPGTLELPNWDKESQTKARDALTELGKLGFGGRVTFGTRYEVDPIAHLIGTAVAWGGNPREAAIYQGNIPKANDGRTVHTLTVRDVPVDAFWSITVYNEKGYLERNDLDAYSLNNLTARPNADGSFTVQFGGCDAGTRNCLPIMKGWSYTVRLYRPRREILNGSWVFPDAQPVE